MQYTHKTYCTQMYKQADTHTYTIPAAKTNYISYALPSLTPQNKRIKFWISRHKPLFELWGAHSAGSGLLLSVEETRDCPTRKRRKRHVLMHPTIGGGSQHFHWAKDQKRPLSRLDSQLRRPEFAKQIYNEDIRLQTQLTPITSKVHMTAVLWILSGLWCYRVGHSRWKQWKPKYYIGSRFVQLSLGVV